METYHIHIEGIVQGVGFRPFVYKLAKKQQLNGWVNNSNDGVHIEFNASRVEAEGFLSEIMAHLPPLAVVTNSMLQQVEKKEFTDFIIADSHAKQTPKVLLTPDVKMCKACRQELYDSANRRYQYPFITCTNCGPRYSIIEKLPYDRPNTTMKKFEMCAVCREEYNNPMERRHFSQTNSCPDCAVEMQLWDQGKLVGNFTNLDYIVEQWEQGKIVAVKGIGGYLLTCDATNKKAIELLRERKRRPYKPFALMYPSVEAIKKDCRMTPEEIEELESIHAPIVLLQLKEHPEFPLALKSINDGLSRLGIMIPYTPLFDLLLSRFKKPVVATSGNITDSSIIYEDRQAVDQLSSIADVILMNNRDIVIPQDDGVVLFSNEHQQKITIRRSRGKAPVYINPNLKLPENIVFTAGSLLKSVFGLLNKKNIYISQYLGNTDNFQSQTNYEKTFTHFEKVFKPEIDTVVVDKHPDYFSTRFGKELARKYHADLLEVQHHKAHFYSVLGENDLLGSDEKILGVVWDGTGLGDDGHIWGGEFFVYENRKMIRVGHLDEFDHILGDKMVKEPRISALAMTKNIPEAMPLLKSKFSDTEWKIYQQLLQKDHNLRSSSMGRLFDAVASLLYGFDRHHYDARATMKLEERAARYYYQFSPGLSLSYLKDDIPEHLTQYVMRHIINDLLAGKDKEMIAARFHLTLVDFILRTAEKFNIRKLAFSGGVFQNALLVDMIIRFLDDPYHLYFHKEFSPNDEGIPFGQLMYYVDNHQIL